MLWFSEVVSCGRRALHSIKDMSRLSKRLSDYRSMAADMRAEAAQVRQQLGHLQHEMCDFISLMGPCCDSCFYGSFGCLVIFG